MKSVLFTYYSNPVQDIFLENVESLLKNSSCEYDELIICSQIDVPLKIIKALSKYTTVNRVFPDINSQRAKKASNSINSHKANPFLLTALSQKNCRLTVFDSNLFVIDWLTDSSNVSVFYKSHTGLLSPKMFTIVNTDAVSNLLINSLIDCDFADSSVFAKFSFVITNGVPFSSAFINNTQFIFSEPTENDVMLTDKLIALDLSNVDSPALRKKIWAIRKDRIPKVSTLSKVTAKVVDRISAIITLDPTSTENIEHQPIISESASPSIEEAFSYFDKIFVINLSNRPDRLSDFKSQLSLIGLSQLFIDRKVEIFPAISIPNDGAEGCKQSHYSIVKTAKAQGFSRILVFEDDAKFIGSIEKLVASIQQLKKIKWDVFYLGCNPVNSANQIDYNLAKISNAYTTHAIAYNSTVYDHLISSIAGGRFKVLDEWLAADVQYKFSCISSYPLQFTQFAGFSNIERRYVDYHSIVDNFNNATQHFIIGESTSLTARNHYKLHTDYEDDVFKHSASVGFLIVATGKYDVFVDPLINSIERYVLPNNPKHYHIFTDKPSINLTTPNYTLHKIDHRPFPYPTLHRFHFFSKYSNLLTQDYLAYIDADTLISSKIGTEILTSRTVTQHCGYVNMLGTFESDQASACYVSEASAKNYYGGGFYCLTQDEFINMTNWCKDTIDHEESHGRVPVWHDESAINKYFTMIEPTRVLSPSYHYPEDNPRIYESWGESNFPCKILLLNKNHKEIRS